MKLRTETRGAALLIAVSILAILLALTVTFYTTSRIEMRLATNKRDSVSAQFVTEAGLALAQAHLRDDHAKRPTYTSLDHAWRTFFNGAWFAGKDWALSHREIDGDVVGDPSLPPIVYAEFVRRMQNPDDLYIPRVDANVYDQADDAPPTPEELLLQPWAIPDLLDTVNNPDELTYAEWVDTWADVDVDDDGLKDAVWVPLPIDVIADDDGIDNNLNGIIDEPGELATFLYAHPTQENVAVLAAPFYAVEADEDGNVLGDPVDYTAQFAYNAPDWTVVLEGSDPDIPRRDNDFSQIIDDAYGYVYPDLVYLNESVPLFDDDNVRREFTEHELQTHVPHQYNIVHNDYFPGTEGQVLTFSGEPECEVAGRVAVLVTDEASRVNLNTAHGRHFRDLPPQPPSTVAYLPDGSPNNAGIDAFFGAQGAGLMGRALGEGLGPHEYDLRVLSDMGVARSGRVDAARSGAPGGRTFPAQPGAETGGDYFYPDDDRLAAVEAVPYVYDANLPGYGRVDDDGDAFWMAYDGIDNDGDGLIDEGFALPKAGDVDGDGVIDFDDGLLFLTDPYTGDWSQVSFPEFAGDGYDDRYQYLLGQFEGIDAPQEQRQFRPHRNLVAESDGVNNDAPFGDTKTDELGELGDQHYYTREQLKLVTGIGGTTFSRNRSVLTVHSADRNFRYNLEGDAPALSGLKLNYNLATPSQIATATINDLGYRPQFASDPALTAAERFAQGLRVEGVRFESDATAPLLGPSGPTSFEIDPVLRVQQTAVNIVDNRDPDSARTTLTSSTGDDWAADVGLGASRRINYTSAGIESIRINEIMARPVRRVEAEMYNTLAPPDSLLYRWAYVPGGVVLEDRLAEQFNPNYFTPQEFEDDYGKRDFDMTQATLPRDRIVAAGNGPSDLHTLDNYTVPIDPARSLWDGRPVWVNDADIDPFPPGSTYGVPAAPSIAVAGRRYMPGEDASDPTAYHLGAGSYISFSSRFVDADNVINDVSATNVAIAAPPPTPLLYGEEWHETPNMIQFRFGPGPGLPPGRYYLLANVTRNGNAATTTMLQGQENKLNYVIKYGQAGDDILSDAVGFVAGSEISYLDFLGGGAFQDVPGLGYVYDPITAAFGAVHKGDAGDGPIIGTRPDVDGVQRETGMVFLPSRPEPDPTLIGALAPYGNREEFYAYTVVIPEYAADPADQEYLYLGMWKSNDPQYTTGDPLNDDLVVNYFEFSQEPDHEWVEVVNVAAVDPVRPIEDQYIDMSDWRLQVGRTATQRHHRLFTVPEGTRIAPGGSLILAVTKFDVGADKFNQNSPADGDFSALSVLRRNGLGLAATDDDDLFPMFGVAGTRATQITVPPFPPVRPFRAVDDPLLINRPLGDSIFFRTPLALPLHDAETGLPSLNEWVDFIDADGDGLIGNSGVPLVVNVGGVDYAINDDFLFDTVIEQIVEPFPVEWRIQSSANDWPSNYPGPGLEPAFGSEARKPWDRIVQLSEVSLDRLGTNPSARLAQLARVVLDGGVFPNTPEEDWEDNDLDNATLSNDGVDNSGTSYLSYDQFTGAFAYLGDAGNPDFDNLGIDEPYEGVDEGRYLLEARRAGVPVAVPGAYHPDPVNHAFRTELDDIEVLSGDYLGGAADPPEWKRFIERRLFPGDAVYVTLYDGPQSEARVVDRITYTQLDIENAALDDGVVCLYENETGPAALNPANLRMWPENTMGVDFYRSLERKHPLYHGDLAGVTNRWEATDGAYDDWDGGQGPFYFGDGVWYQPDAVDPDAVRTDLAHGLSGTPGRMNFLHRTVETGDITATRIENDVLAWQHPRANVRNRPFTTPGQLATLHQFGMTAGVGANVAAVERLDKVLMGRNGVLFDAGVDDSVRELEKLVESGTHATLTLTAAQADFYPLWPDPAAYTEAEYTEFIEWYNATTPGDPNVRPRAWTPIFLFPLPDDPLVTDPGLEDTYAMGAVHPLAAVDPTAAMDVPVQLNFLFRSPRLIPPGYPTPPGGAVDYYAALRARWSLLQRTVMYVSMNPQDFQPTQEDGSYLDPNDVTLPTMPDGMPPAEALFVWDGDDGLENGAYDVYVVTMDDLSRLDDVYERLAGIDADRVGDLFATAAAHDDRFDPKTLIGQAVRPEEMGITVEFFTDRDGNRRCWSGADAPQPALMNRGIMGDPLAPQESFGLQVAPEPSTEGLVYYGQVTVENNYLGLLLRNWAQGGRLNRFSRVILTSSRRTSGKLNINTATTRELEYTGDTKSLNTLAGAPGALMRARTVVDEVGDPPRLVLSFPGELDGIIPSEAFYLDAQGVAAGIESSAPAHYDGRYYRNAAELLTRGLGALATDPTEPLVDPTFILRTGRLSHLWPADWIEPTEWPDETDPMAPIVYDEKIQRFTRLSNLVTTHSDVFEVIVLGQSGYVTNDAVLDVEDAAGTPVRVVDWRNRFVVTGEKKIRTVYER